MTVSEPMQIIAALGYLCLAAAIAGCIITIIEAYTVLRFAGTNMPMPSIQPPVTVLKPLHGTAEPDLLGRLGQFYDQDYAGPVQVVFGVRDDASASAAIARQVRAELSHETIELVADARGHGSNRKVSNLVNMLPSARHDILVLSDSDIVVSSDYLSTVTSLLEAPRAGAVTCLYYGIGEGLWARLSALTINAYFLPLAIMAGRLRLAHYCGGATIALRRTTLDRIGGFGAFADVLADDHAIGAAVRSLGHHVVIAPFLVGHRCFEVSLRQLFLQQLRAARTIKTIQPIGYAGSFVVHPISLALLGAFSGSVATAAGIAAIAVVLRLMTCRCVERRFGLPRQDYWLVPLQDVTSFAIYVVSFFGKMVHWRGIDYRVAPSGVMVEQDLGNA